MHPEKVGVFIATWTWLFVSSDVAARLGTGLPSSGAAQKIADIKTLHNENAALHAENAALRDARRADEARLARLEERLDALEAKSAEIRD